jgi:hypothetical protein
VDENLIPMERAWLARRMQQMQREVEDAQRAGDSKRADELFTERMALRQLQERLRPTPK